MAIKDPSGKAILAQTNTKTVGAPAASTGLTGDQAPASIFSVSDYDLVRNQVHLEESQVRALEILTLIGDVTGMRSSSGPIPNTGEVKTTGALTSTGKVTVFQPALGETYQVTAMSMDPEGSGSFRGIGLLVDGTSGETVEIFDASGTGSAEAVQYTTPIFIDNNCYLDFSVITVDTSLALKAACVRVR